MKIVNVVFASRIKSRLRMAKVGHPRHAFKDTVLFVRVETKGFNDAVDGDAMDRRFLRIMLVRSHAEGTAGNEPHVGMLLVSGR
jgi:hypothetical protein